MNLDILLRTAICFAFLTLPCDDVLANEENLGKHEFQLPDGFSIQQIAGPPLVQRPMHMCFDTDEVLYVTDSSGNTDKAPVQLKDPQHRVLRLVDIDGDGVFDESTVFADKLPLPEGILVHDGSVYVGAPPHIWKLRDTDGDHVADQRTEWFDGGSIEGCGNDMHGPYLGPDGFFYWCKGAFAPQEHELTNGRTLTSRAAHIYRARPDGSQLERVITGGMNNPVGLAFSNTGERFLSGTFFDLSKSGRRDGILHAVYGGMYGRKNERALDPHPNTGRLLPILSQLGPAAPSGIVMPQHHASGLKGDLICTEFNTRRLSRHQLSKCTICHLKGDKGVRLGPDLTWIGAIRSERDLLEAIVFPSASIARYHEIVNVLTKDGAVVSGLLVRETVDEIFLSSAEGVAESVPYQDIQQARYSNVSLMPDGLDKLFKPEEIADLVAFLKASKPPDVRLPVDQ